MPYRNTIYEPAYKVYESNPNAGEPEAEDGYIPRNRYAKPGYFGMHPSVTDTNYKVLNDPVLIKKKEELRLALREEFIKQAFDPYKAASGTGGIAFDSNVHRYITMMRTQSLFWRPSWTLTAIGVSVFFLPVGLLYYIGEAVRERRERKYRSGTVSYHEREFKFIA